MSGGTPVGDRRYMRQRYGQGSGSGSDDIEDDASSRLNPFSQVMIPRTRTWVEIMENVLWTFSVLFIIYYGDRESNFIYLLWHDQRIRRVPLYFGVVGVGLNIVIFFYTSMKAWGGRTLDEKWEFTSISALPYVTFLGLGSFILLCFALWPIWSFLTLPLLFTLFMAGMVVLPHILIERFRPPIDDFRID
ncbi:hypothetical protein ACFE04_009008 [Oxalis oulophora]